MRRYKGEMQILFVLPDYFEQYPKPCYGGWGQLYLVVAPDGKVLPCHGATQITTLTFDNAQDHSLEWIWRESAAFKAFRGDAVDAGALPELPAQDRRLRRLPLPGLRAHRRRGEHRPRVRALSRPGADRCGGGGVERLDGVSLPRDRRAAAGVSSAIEAEGLGRDYGDGARARGARTGGAAREHRRPAGSERRGQDHRDAAPRHPPLPHPWIGPGLRSRRGARPACGAAPTRPGVPGDHGRRSPHSRGEPPLRRAPRRTRRAARARGRGGRDRARRPHAARAAACARALGRVAAPGRRGPRHPSPARSPHPRRADRRSRPRASRRRLGPARRPAQDPRDHRALLHPLPRGGRAGGSGRAARPWPGRGGRRAGRAAAPSWARRSRRSRVPAPIVWRARSAGSERRGWS